MSFVERYTALRSHTDTSNQLIEDVIIYSKNVEDAFRKENTRLEAELQDAQLDLEDARRSRRDLQQQVNLANQRLLQTTMENETIKNRNPYVMVLIDGDGMIFNEEYIRAGVEGGKKAANTLRNAILEEYTDLPEDTEVIAKVIANMAGLGKAMAYDRSIDDAETLRLFAIGFTQGKASFDFVDVGFGKERADSKIKEAARWNLRQLNCKHVFMGIGFDAGYAPFLDEVLRDASVTRRVTILEGFPVVRELVQTGVAITSFDHIFRKEKLVDHRQIMSQESMQNATTATKNIPSTWAGLIASSTPVASTTGGARIASPMSGNGASPMLQNSQAVMRPKATPKPAWNPGPRGSDDPETQYSKINKVALEKIRKRSKENRVCNNHYLRGPCVNFIDASTKSNIKKAKSKDPNFRACPFVHDFEPTEDDLKALGYLTRLNPCTKGQDCEVEGCIYGHHCPSVVVMKGDKLESVTGIVGGEALVCEAWNCRFTQEQHPPGTVVVNIKTWDDEY